jgi:hypothetical protein
VNIIVAAKQIPVHDSARRIGAPPERVKFNNLRLIIRGRLAFRGAQRVASCGRGGCA